MIIYINITIPTDYISISMYLETMIYAITPPLPNAKLQNHPLQTVHL